MSEEEIRILKSQYVKICKFIKRNNTYVIPTVCAIVTLTPFIFLTTLFNAVVFGIPHSIHFMIFAYYYWNSIGFQLIRQRVRRLDQILCEIRQKKRFARIREIFQSFDSVNNGINEYNTTFWSKFLLISAIYEDRWDDLVQKTIAIYEILQENFSLNLKFFSNYSHILATVLL